MAGIAEKLFSSFALYAAGDIVVTCRVYRLTRETVAMDAGRRLPRRMMVIGRAALSGFCRLATPMLLLPYRHADVSGLRL